MLDQLALFEVKIGLVFKIFRYDTILANNNNDNKFENPKKQICLINSWKNCVDWNLSLVKFSEIFKLKILFHSIKIIYISM